MRGKLIAIEGIDRVGKSTLARRLAGFFESTKIPYILTREPGGTPLGEQIRHILLSTTSPTDLCLEAEVLLFLASRAQHVRQVISPALEQGIHVITDRFSLTTHAYQGAGGGLSPAATTIQKELMAVPSIDHLIVLDCDPREIAARSQQEEARLDRFESKSPDYFDRARAAFRSADGFCESRILIDASQPPDAVYEQAESWLMNAMYG